MKHMSVTLDARVKSNNQDSDTRCHRSSPLTNKHIARRKTSRIHSKSVKPILRPDTSSSRKKTIKKYAHKAEKLVVEIVIRPRRLLFANRRMILSMVS